MGEKKGKTSSRGDDRGRVPDSGMVVSGTRGSMGVFGGVGINEIIRVNERHKRTLCRRQHILYIPRDDHRTSIAPDGILKFEHSGQKKSVGLSRLRWREHGDLKRL